MRQWELIGITDQVQVMPRVAVPLPRIREERKPEETTPRERPMFFWTTDTALRLHGVSESAAEILGLTVDLCEGHDLLDLFGIDPRNIQVLNAHTASLSGDAAVFSLRGERTTVRCRVEPVHDARGRVTGTYCLATRVEDVDVRDAAGSVAVA